MLYICQYKGGKFPADFIEGIEIREGDEADLGLYSPYEGYIEEIGTKETRACLVTKSSCFSSTLTYVDPYIYTVHMPVHPRLKTSTVRALCEQITKLTQVSVSMHRYVPYMVKTLGGRMRRCTRWVTVAAVQDITHSMMSAAIILTRMMSVGMTSACRFYNLPSADLALWIQRSYERCPEPRFYAGEINESFITWDISVELNVENPHPDIFKYVGMGFIKALQRCDDDNLWKYYNGLNTRVSLADILNAANEIAWQHGVQNGNN